MKKYILLAFIAPALLLASFSNTRESRKKDFIASCNESGDQQLTEPAQRKLFHEYCDCAGEKIVNKFTEADWKRLEKLQNSGQEDEVKKMTMPIVQTCLTEMRRSVAEKQ